MKLSQGEINGIKFFYREGFSDAKTFIEVLKQDCYQKKGMTIKANESWLDCGGNVGAFSLLAASKGATTVCYEPDPYNCEMIEKNLKLNGFENAVEIKEAALVHDERKSTILTIGPNGGVWRNSIMHKGIRKKGIKVPCINFDTQANRADNCKMDIEGAEIPILTHSMATFKKLVYEWSFDYDPYIPKLWNVIDKQKASYRVEAEYKSLHYAERDVTFWGATWFPKNSMVYCFAL